MEQHQRRAAAPRRRGGVRRRDPAAPRRGARPEDVRHRNGDGEPAVKREPISRRRFLRGSATAAGAAAASAAAGWRIGPASAVERGSAVRMRSIGVASGSGLRPSLLAFAGLAGFEELLEKAGAQTAFRWTDLPPASGEATAIVSAFVPQRATRRGGELLVTGTEDPTAIRMVS